MIVVDASVLAPALADDGPHGDRARARLHGEELAAPELLDLEVVSVVRRAERAGLVDGRRAEQALTDLAALPLARVPHRPLLPRVWALRGNLTPYDAAYVAVAEQLGAVLVTADSRLSGASGPRCAFDVLR